MKKIYKKRNARKSIRNSVNKLDTLKSVSQAGKIFSVEFIKKDGSTRLMSCRTGVKKHLRGGVNTVSHLPEYITVFSVNDRGYRNISVPNIKQIKGCGKVFYFDK